MENSSPVAFCGGQSPNRFGSSDPQDRFTCGTPPSKQSSRYDYCGRSKSDGQFVPREISALDSSDTRTAYIRDGAFFDFSFLTTKYVYAFFLSRQR